MDLALYDPEDGYYARSARRSGRAGDFFTSVDVGPLFGELLEIQIAEMAHLLAGKATAEHAERASADSRSSAVAFSAGSATGFTLVEAGAGDGRLSADILRSMRRLDPAVYESLRLHLVETSAAARAAQRVTLGDAADRLASSGPDLPSSFDGVLIANELLDAMAVHQVVMRDDGLREVYVAAGHDRLHLVEAMPSTPAIADYLDRLGVALEPGWRVEVNLAAIEWIRDAARRLRRGFMVLIDYGHEARELYSATHAAGTLTSFSQHRSGGVEAAGAPPWLADPGERDITAHVDFTSVRAAAESEGMETIALLDQTYFLLGLFEAGARRPESASERPDEQRPGASAGRPEDRRAKASAALKTLIMPGGLGSTMKVLIVGKGVGHPALAGTSFKVRLT
jgi:SAM-dependent MidA family methyltransferase